MKYILALDQKILLWLNALVKGLGFLNKIFAEWLIYLVPIVFLWLWFYSEKSKKVAMRAFFSIMLAWPVLALIVGKIFNRPRPFELTQIQELLFHRPTYSFPSDHAAALFAVVMSFWLSGYKKLSLFFLAVAILVCTFRVATGLHFPTDILAGAALGILAAWLIDLFDKPLDIVYNFIIRLAKIARLA
jgi:undecaprenyl-diphosphatase